MAYPIEHKLVIGIASSALFDLTESHQIYLDGGEDAYRTYQEQNIGVILGRGVAFPFIRRFLNINLKAGAVFAHICTAGFGDGAKMYH